MVDLHSHILPFVDDGASDIETAFEMLRMAKDTSTKAIVLTPHSNLYEYDKNLLLEMSFVFDAFKEKVEAEGIDIDIYLGGEIFMNNDALGYAEKKLLPTINNSRFMLVEFDFYTRAGYIIDKINGLARLGYVPIVAHPERYECVKKSPSLSMEIMNSGGLLQINKGSLVDEFGSTARLCASELIHHKTAQFVASDAHSITRRNTDLELAYDIVCDEINESFASKLFISNPTAVINNERLSINRPIQF